LLDSDLKLHRATVAPRRIEQYASAGAGHAKSAAAAALYYPGQGLALYFGAGTTRM
jgi:hypothetical protein